MCFSNLSVRGHRRRRRRSKSERSRSRRSRSRSSGSNARRVTQRRGGCASIRRRSRLSNGRKGVSGMHQPVGHIGLELLNNGVDLTLQTVANVLAVVLAHVVLVAISVVVLLAHSDGVVGEEDVAVVAVALAHFARRVLAAAGGGGVLVVVGDGELSLLCGFVLGMCTTRGVRGQVGSERRYSSMFGEFCVKGMTSCAWTQAHNDGVKG